MVIVAGFVVLLTNRTAPFHVPETKCGGMPFRPELPQGLELHVPSYCQSPAKEVGSLVISVMNRAGNIGRSDTSVPAWSPLSNVEPTCGSVLLSGSLISAENG